MSKKRPALTVTPDPGSIHIRGARQNNLKGFDLDLPLGKLIVVTGPSGSGKSSLAFDTLYAEGQRRYVETFSPYTRQFLDRMDKPRVDEIRGIPPAIAIEQSNNVKSTRSTVGTMTDLNDYLKLVFPRLATAHCPECSREVRPDTARSIVEQVFGGNKRSAANREQTAAFAEGDAILVTFAVPAPPGTKPADFFAFLNQQGYLRVWLDGAIIRTDEPTKAARLPALVQVIQDRVTIAEEARPRFTEAIETALRLGGGKIAILTPHANPAPASQVPFSTGWHCAHCDIDITPPTPGLFSFNHPHGACPTCRGFGRTISIDLLRAIPDRSLSIAAGCVKPFQTENGADCQRDLMRAARDKGVDVKTAFADLPSVERDWLIYGEDHRRPAAKRRGGEELWNEGLWYGVSGFFRWLESKAYKMHVRVLLSRYRSYTECPDCRGTRYQPATLNFRFAGKTLPELQALPIAELLALLTAHRARLASGALTHAADPATTEMLLGEVLSRLGYLEAVGLGYLSLDRPTRTLSGGETERVNLTTCLGANLVNTLFVLDEPSVGLHPRDTGRLIRIMQSLRDKGNTLLVVEHEESVIRAADHLVELGPGRGEAGGQLVFAGEAALLDLAAPSKRSKPGAARRAAPTSLTTAYLTGEKSIPIPSTRRRPMEWLRLEGASAHNLQQLDVEIPLGVFACVTGVSGSGKSTLVHSVLYENLLRTKNLASENSAGALKSLRGAEQIAQVVLVDQSPLARTPKSTPALYLGVFDHIRELFAATPRALSEGLSASAFSFNGGAGRCERCGGSGFERIEMQFLSDVFVRCPECEGRRYQPHVLKILLQGKSISDVLGLTVTEAVAFFEKLGAQKIARPLGVLAEVGLGYLQLGQPLNALSGGESQRLKLVERLINPTATASPAHPGHQPAPHTLLILDEPTTGLHFDDIAQLLRVFERLVAQGHSLVVIEHNLEVIKCADYVLDLGPEAGARGGQLIAQGTPEEIAAVPESHTGQYLRAVLNGEAQPWTAMARDSTTPPSLSNAADFSETSSRVAEDPPRLTSHVSPLTNAITITGAREHNLKNISLSIPRDQLVVITGLSGSGKSTLAFDLLFAEGQRRFLDVMSPYARQFVEQLEKPDVDRITGLPPSVAIEQRVTRGGGKSTVATVTEVYHFLRLLFSKLGTQHCPDCGCAVQKQTAVAVTKQVAALARKGRVRVFATLIKARKGFHTDVAKWAQRQGFKTLLVDGKLVAVDDFKALERFREHTIEVLVGEATPADAREARRKALTDLVKTALDHGRGTLRVLDAKNRATVLSTERACPQCGQSFEELDPRLFSFNSPHGWCAECRGFGEVWKQYVNPRLESALEQELDIERQSEALESGESVPCPQCLGARLNPQARAVHVGKRPIAEFVNLSVRDALATVGKLKFGAEQKRIARDIVPEIVQRLRFMGQVGLDYLALSRSARTLSGGEGQRIRLAAQLGSNLRGVLYVLDEPTIGLHPRDNDALLDTLLSLKARGNSLVVVEHDDETMRRADTILDLGPGAGVHGGEVVAQGTLAEISAHPLSATGRSLREPLVHPTRGTRRALKGADWLELRGAKVNNLRGDHARFPIGRLSVITGISGSGKSTLMRGALKPAVEAALKKGAKNGKPASFGKLLGVEHLEAIREVDQSPIGKTSRSTPATYLGVWDEIRALFAQLPLARMRGYTASRFSFNTEGGRCETCGGQGVIKMEMTFLPTSYHPCPDCHGARFNPATLEVLYDGKSIGDVLKLPLAEAAELFRPLPKIHRPLALLCDTGLGYLQLGQPSPTLSGGEAQRLKLVYELAQGTAHETHARLRKMRQPKSTLYLLEEPTIGLHLADVTELLKVLHRLVDSGATVIVIEHHLALIADADYVVDIGPEAGAAGGRVVAAGTPEEIARSKESRTAPFLRRVLSPRPPRANGQR
jgi:excinuclease ABC subunit A